MKDLSDTTFVYTRHVYVKLEEKLCLNKIGGKMHVFRL